MGLFDSRRINLLDQDKPYGMEDRYYDAYKPGVINGAFGVDSLNINRTIKFTTTTYKSYLDENGRISNSSFDLKQTVAANATYSFTSLGPVPGSLAITGAALEGQWSNLSDAEDVSRKTVNASFAGELAYSCPDITDFVFTFRSINSDDFSLAAFVQPQFLKPWNIDITAGYTFARLDHIHYDAHNEYAVDFRLRWQPFEKFSLTTMHNYSYQGTWAGTEASFTNSNTKDSDGNKISHSFNTHSPRAMWNMLSLSFQGTKDIRFIVTGEFINTNFEAFVDNQIMLFPAMEIACTPHINVSFGNVFKWEAVGSSDTQDMTMQFPIVLSINY